MKKLKIAAIVLGSLIGLYYLAFGGFYLAGYRWYCFPTASMEPTIPKGEYVFGRITEGYRNSIQRFQIAIFTTKEAPAEIYAKRVVGLPGERVTVSDRGVFINGAKLALPPVVRIEGLGVKPCEVVVPMDAVFFLGDNTVSSFDSRYLGPISLNRVIGRLLFKE